MIFATVGTQLPFPRFIATLDRFARETGAKIVAQTCEADNSYDHLDDRRSLAPRDFDACIARCNRMVGHAGIGTILSAQKAGKPVILFPRRASLGEHRNEHQLATVKSLGERIGIHIAHDEDELRALLQAPDLSAPTSAPSRARLELIDNLRGFIVQGRV